MIAWIASVLIVAVYVGVIVVAMWHAFTDCRCR